MTTATQHNLANALPPELRDLEDPQTAIPQIAQDARLTAEIEQVVRGLPSTHDLHLADARTLDFLGDESLHLAVTSPPYWTLKEYNRTEGQLGYVADYEEFLHDLDTVWRHVYRALVPGGRLVCVVGDVCLSRRRNKGRHTVVPLHSSIQEHCRQIGFDNLAPIIWYYKIANACGRLDRGCRLYRSGSKWQVQTRPEKYDAGRTSVELLKPKSDNSAFPCVTETPAPCGWARIAQPVHYADARN